MQRVCGIIAAFDIWEMAIIQGLLNNSETWTEITGEALADLENLQYFFLRMVLDTPRTTPKVALLWETGMTSMECRVIKRKLRFIKHLKRSKGHLANEILKEQIANNWPGLSKEGNLICEKIGINVSNFPLADYRKKSFYFI